MADNRAFLGIKQVKKETFDGLPESDKTGYLWFVREHMSEGNEPDDCQIFLGNRKYGETSSDPILKNDIIVTDGAPIGNVSLGIWSGDTITKGTPIEEVLMKLLTKELFPGAPTKPSISATDTTHGIKEIGTSVSITQPSPTYNSGVFNSNGFASPSQPSVEGVTWTEKTVTNTITGFSIRTGMTSALVDLGSNEVKYTFKGTYSEPTNMPWTNLKNYTKSRSSIYTGDTSSLEESDRATWVSTGTSKTASMTATGVYPCFCNISGSTFTSDITSDNKKYVPTSSNNLNKIYYTNVPSETASLVFKFAYPSGRTIEFYGPDTTETGYALINNSKYTITSESNFYNGKTYMILTSGLEATGGISRCYFKLSKGLNSE